MLKKGIAIAVLTLVLLLVGVVLVYASSCVTATMCNGAADCDSPEMITSILPCSSNPIGHFTIDRGNIVHKEIGLPGHAGCWNAAHTRWYNWGYWFQVDEEAESITAKWKGACDGTVIFVSAEVE